MKLSLATVLVASVVEGKGLRDANTEKIDLIEDKLLMTEAESYHRRLVKHYNGGGHVGADRNLQNCEDNNQFCESWAADGQCEQNPGYMNIGCAKTCNACEAETAPQTTTQPTASPTSRPTVRLAQQPTEQPDPTSAPSCVDKQGGCEQWASSGECEQNPGYMNSNCARACNTCDAEPASQATTQPSARPTATPTATPTVSPTVLPTISPTTGPTARPSEPLEPGTWVALSPEEQEAASELGYDQESWEADDAVRWWYECLTSDQKAAATLLGFGEEEWNRGGDPPLGLDCDEDPAATWPPTLTPTPAPVFDAPDGKFRLEMYCERDFNWHGERSCDDFCLTYSRCESGGSIRIKRCGDSSKEQWERKDNVLRPDCSGGSRLCVADDELRRCDTKLEFAYEGSNKFEIRRNGKLLTQHHHPRSGEPVDFRNMSITRKNKTNFWKER